MSRTLVQFGAGAIGRSFIAQLFSSAGYEVVFVDIDEELVAELNRRRGYDVVIKDAEAADRSIRVSPVRAVSARDREAVAAELESCAVAATAVGKEGLESVAALLAEGLRRRSGRKGGGGRKGSAGGRQGGGGRKGSAGGRQGGAPLDVILAENVPGCAEQMRELMTRSLERSILDRYCGLVETSIGKMVPLVPEAERAGDPLLAFAEPYNTLIADAEAFRNETPEVAELAAVRNIGAYVDRKLFIHNLGHAATAYLSYREAPSVAYVADALELPGIAERVRLTMEEAASALAAAYPGIFSERELSEHIDDLLRRFRNRALGDTVFRVGRDLPRKLSRNDRVIGAMLLAASQGMSYRRIAEVAAAAFGFGARDERNRLDPRDARFHEQLRQRGLYAVMRDICGLDPNRKEDVEVSQAIVESHTKPAEHSSTR